MADVTAIQRSAVASFLRARLNEEAQAGPAGNHPQQHRALHRLRQGGTHIGRWDPARVLADVQARSRVLDAYERALAMPDDDPGRPAEVGLGAGRCWRLPSRTGSTRTSTPPGTSDPRPWPSGSRPRAPVGVTNEGRIRRLRRRWPHHRRLLVHAEVLADQSLSSDAETPTKIDPDVVEAADIVVTTGCGETCPIFPGKRYEDWKVDDPAGQDIDTVRRIVDDVDGRVRKLLAKLGVSVNA